MKLFLRRLQQKLLVKFWISFRPASARARTTKDNAHQVVLDFLAEAQEIIPHEVCVFLSENNTHLWALRWAQFLHLFEEGKFEVMCFIVFSKWLYACIPGCLRIELRGIARWLLKHVLCEAHQEESFCKRKAGQQMSYHKQTRSEPPNFNKHC